MRTARFASTYTYGRIRLGNVNTRRKLTADTKWRSINIGAVKRDIHENERNLSATYPALNSPTGLRILLSDYHALIGRQYQGDYDATVILADLHTAIELANLTNRQRQALDLVYGEDLTQVDAGRRMGIRQDVVSEHIDKAIEAIADIYYYWSGHGEGYAMTEGESA